MRSEYLSNINDYAASESSLFSFSSVWFVFLWLALFGGGCDETSPASTSISAGGQVDAGEATGGEVNQGGEVEGYEEDGGAQSPPCDESAPPLIMAHGLLAAGDTWSRHARRLISSGRCSDRIIAYDWNTLDQQADHTSSLDLFIDEVRDRFDVTRVDLMGHSAGGKLGYDYLMTPERAEKVRRYIHIGSFPNEGPAGPAEAPIPTLNLWSPDDTVVEGADIEGATNVSLPGEDHYSVATSNASFDAIYQFLYDERVPETLHDLSTEALSVEETPLAFISGRGLTLGENQPEVGTRVDIWEIDPETTARQTLTHEVTLGTRGEFKDLELSVGRSYEMTTRPDLNHDEASPDPIPPTVRYFRPSVRYNDPLVYLRTLPGPGSLASLILNPIPFTDDQSVVVIFSASRAFSFIRDVLTLNGDPLLSEENASPEDTAIALFIFDINGDGEPGGRLPLFDTFPFLSALDLPLSPDPNGRYEVRYNDTLITLPAAPSSEGVLIAVFP